MKDRKILGFCIRQGIRLPSSWRHCLNAVRYHNKNETKKHFLAKAEVAFEIMKQGGTVFSELELNGAVADLFWLDERMVIEFESEYSEAGQRLKEIQFYNFNVLVFDLKKQTIKEIFEKTGLKKASV